MKFLINMKNLIVFSLWGNNPFYWIGAKQNIKLAKQFYPDFVCRIYIDKKCDSTLIDSIKQEDCEIVLMEPGLYTHTNISNRFNHNGIFWRFLALGDPDVDVVLSRDCDSRISQREVLAVKEWMSSDKKFHIMRDHPEHRVPILSGMWGCRGQLLKNINQLFQYWSQFSNKGLFQAEDQDFLGQVIYPIIQKEAIEHSEFGINYGNQITNFPSIRVDYEFVGDVFDENDNRHPEYWKIIKKLSI